MNVHRIDDLSLLNIFNRLPIPDLLVAGQVCRRWNTFRAKSALTRDSLTLLLGKPANLYVTKSTFKIPYFWRLKNDDGSRMFTGERDDPDLDKHVVLKRNSLSRDCAKFLVGLFSGVTNLIVSIRTATARDLDQVTYMLKQWHSTVVRLRIYSAYTDKNYCKVDNDKIDTHVGLLNAVNGLTSLKRLEFYVSFSFIKGAQGQIEMPILGQLEELKFCTWNYLNFMVDSLKRYAEPNEKLNNICFDSPTISFDKLVTLSPELSSHISQLHAVFRSSNISSFNSFCSHFKHLTSLSIKLADANFLNPTNQVTRGLVFRSLAPLTQLIQLKLIIDSRRSFLDSLARNARPGDIVPLASVKVLTLVIINGPIRTHDLIRQIGFAKLFPKLQVVSYYQDAKLCGGCVTQGIGADRYEKHCLQPTLEPFADCAHLQLVKTSHPNKEWSVNDIQEEEQYEEDYVWDDYEDFQSYYERMTTPRYGRPMQQQPIYGHDYEDYDSYADRIYEEMARNPPR